MKKQIGIGVLLLLVVIGTIISLTYRSSVYPLVPSKYDYEKEHMVYLREIQAQKPDGYVDSAQYLEDRPYWFITGLIELYDQRHEQKDIDEATRLLNKIYDRCQTDTDGDSHKDCRGYYTYDSNLRTAGYISDMFARYAWIVKKNKVTAHYADADRYSQLVDKEFLPYFLEFWKPYEADGKKLGYFVPTRDGTIADQFNRDAAIGTTFIWRWKATGDDAFKDVPQRLLNRYFDPVVNPDQYYSGKFYISPKYSWFDPRSGEASHCTTAPDAFVCKGLTDTIHLNMEFELIMAGYENDLVQKSDIDKVTNALDVMMLPNGKIGEKVTPIINQAMEPPRILFPDEVAQFNIWRQTGHIYNIMAVSGLGNKDKVYEIEEILHNNELFGKATGNYYPDAYKCVKDPRYPGLEYCSTDGESRVENMEIFLTIVRLGRYQ